MGNSSSGANAKKAKAPQATREVRRLARKTGQFSSEDVAKLLARFQEIAAESSANPKEITAEQFKATLDEFGVDVASNVLLARLFDAFDASNSGTIDYREFVLGLSMVSSATPSEKLELSFAVYDLDKSGHVHKAEMVQVLGSIHRTSGKHSPLGQGDVEAFVENLFASADKTKNGSLTYIEFARAAMRYPSILEYKVLEDEAKEAAAIGTGGGGGDDGGGGGGDGGGGDDNGGGDGRADSDAAGDAKLVAELARATPYNTADVTKLLARFREIAAESPETGPRQIAHQQFKDVLDEFGIQWRSHLVLKNLFEAFDVSQSGTIDFREFTMGLSMCSRGTPQDKLALAFQIYDVDNCGSIAKEEMVEVLSSIHAKATDFSSFGGRSAGADEAAELVQIIFAKTDKDKSGRLTYMEFFQAALKHPELVSMVLPDPAAAAAAGGGGEEEGKDGGGGEDGAA